VYLCSDEVSVSIIPPFLSYPQSVFLLPPFFVCLAGATRVPLPRLTQEMLDLCNFSALGLTPNHRFLMLFGIHLMVHLRPLGRVFYSTLPVLTPQWKFGLSSASHFISFAMLLPFHPPPFPLTVPRPNSFHSLVAHYVTTRLTSLSTLSFPSRVKARVAVSLLNSFFQPVPPIPSLLFLSRTPLDNPYWSLTSPPCKPISIPNDRSRSHCNALFPPSVLVIGVKY